MFVRDDLAYAQKIVQSCHACIEASKAFQFDALHEHPSVIILSVKDENRLHHVRKFLVDNQVQHVHFYEPDVGNELTSLATEPISQNSPKRKLLRKFQLLKR